MNAFVKAVVNLIYSQFVANMGGVASSSNQGNHHDKRQRISRKYTFISDNYNSLEKVTEGLAQAGLESSNLIVGIDFTKSNEWTGKRSFNGQSLHHIGELPNPYEQALSIIGQTLSTFDEDNLIPCFGFGDGSTHDQNVFSFYPDGRSCSGFTEALARYREIAPNVRLAGPTSFAPIIETAMSIVEESGGQYHVLLIIADGQVTRSIDIENGELSSQEQKTIEAIRKASELPLSIVLVGVGDGPWDTMKQFDDNISSRLFDNFQFVNFSEIMSRNIPQSRKEATFALEALMEIPSQYKATMALDILGRQTGHSRRRVALPPPRTSSSTIINLPIVTSEDGNLQNNARDNDNVHRTSIPPPRAPAILTIPQERTSDENHVRNNSAASTSAEPSRASNEERECPVCLTNRKDMVFGCGHQTCSTCSHNLQKCPICRSHIRTRIKIY